MKITYLATIHIAHCQSFYFIFYGCRTLVYLCLLMVVMDKKLQHKANRCFLALWLHRQLHHENLVPKTKPPRKGHMVPNGFEMLQQRFQTKRHVWWGVGGGARAGNLQLLWGYKFTCSVFPCVFLFNTRLSKLAERDRPRDTGLHNSSSSLWGYNQC